MDNMIYSPLNLSLVIVYVGYSDDSSEFLQLLEISIHRSEREVGIVAFKVVIYHLGRRMFLGAAEIFIDTIPHRRIAEFLFCSREHYFPP